MPRNLTTPVGRFIQGDPFEAQTKDQQGALRVVKTGPNAGQPNPQFFVAIAFAKTDPAWPAFYAELVTEAAGAWPQLFPHGPQPHAPNGGCVMPSFALKVVDGDGYDTTGKANAGKTGFAGHWVLRLATTFAPKVYRPANGAHIEVTNPAELKRGYYVRAAVSVKSNDNPQKPGLYVNFSMLEIVAYGEEIISGPAPGEAFWAPVGALPPGASAVPIASVHVPPGAQAPPGYPPAAPAYPPQAAYAPPPGAVPAPAYTAAAPPAYAPPAAPAAPYVGYVAAPVAPAPAPMAPAPAPYVPAPPAGPVMLPAANGVTYEAYRSAGWGDDQLRQAGYMA